MFSKHAIDRVRFGQPERVVQTNYDYVTANSNQRPNYENKTACPIGARTSVRFTCVKLGRCGLKSALLSAILALSTTVFAAKPPPPPPPPPGSGTLVLDYPGPDRSGASSWGLVVAPTGTIYALGNDYALDPNWGQLVLGSSDSGNNCSVLDDYAPPRSELDKPLKICILMTDPEFERGSPSGQ